MLSRSALLQNYAASSGLLGKAFGNENDWQALQRSTKRKQQVAKDKQRRAERNRRNALDGDEATRGEPRCPSVQQARPLQKWRDSEQAKYVHQEQKRTRHRSELLKHNGKPESFLVRTMLDALTCPSCLEVFRDPILLTCSHSVCLSCADQILALATEEAAGQRNAFAFTILEPHSLHFACPQCKKETPLRKKEKNRKTVGKEQRFNKNTTLETLANALTQELGPFTSDFCRGKMQPTSTSSIQARILSKKIAPAQDGNLGLSCRQCGKFFKLGCPEMDSHAETCQTEIMSTPVVVERRGNRKPGDGSCGSP